MKWLLNCGVGEDSWESLGLQGDSTSPFWRRSALRFLWREWCWSWNSSTLATSCKELTHWKRLWCWEGLGAGGEGDDRGWDGWMASLTRWTWVWVNSGSWWWTGRPGVLQFMGLQRVRHDWATELNWTERCYKKERKMLTQNMYQFCSGWIIAFSRVESDIISLPTNDWFFWGMVLEQGLDVGICCWWVECSAMRIIISALVSGSSCCWVHEQPLSLTLSLLKSHRTNVGGT